MLVIAVISVDAYHFFFFAFSDLIYHLEDIGIGVFWTVPPELGSSVEEASPSAGKITRIVLEPCLRMEVRPYSYFRWLRVTKITSRIVVS